MDANISKQLDELVDKVFFYNGKNYKTVKWKLVAGMYCIVTTSETLQFFPSKIQEDFFDKIEDEEAGEIIQKFSKPVEKVNVVALPSENTTIKETLLETLKKVKENPDYIPQAKAICEITNAMVNVQKTEIDMIKLQNLF